MSRTDVLRKSRDNYSIKLRDFLRFSAKWPNSYCMFFEGQDSKYYSHRIELLKPELLWTFIDCGGKDNLLKLFSIISTHDVHSSAKTAFFVDRDFDNPEDLPSDPRVYITPCYSIENFYVNESAFRKILKNEFLLNEYSETDDSFSNCMEAFDKSLRSFVDSVSALNGWVYLQRRHEKENPGTSRINLNSLNFAQMVNVDLEIASVRYTVEEIEKTTNSTYNVNPDSAKTVFESTPHEERLMVFRGKFQATFLRAYLAKLLQEANSKTPKLFSKKHPSHLNVSGVNLVSELCQYADTPSCLRGFLSAL